MYNSIFLDLDGTVLDFPKSERHAFFSAMRSLGIEVGESDFARYSAINASLWAALERGEVTGDVLRPLRFRKLLEERGAWKWDAVNAAYIAALAQAGIPYPGAEALLRALHTRYRLYVLTNGVRASQEGRLAASGLAPHLDGMLTSEEAGEPKPSPKMFRDAMARLGDTNPRHYLMLGDSLTADMRGAANAGVDGMWYAPKGGEAPDGLPLRYTVRNYAEIARILLKNND